MFVSQGAHRLINYAYLFVLTDSSSGIFCFFTYTDLCNQVAHAKVLTLHTSLYICYHSNNIQQFIFLTVVGIRIDEQS